MRNDSVPKHAIKQPQSTPYFDVNMYSIAGPFYLEVRYKEDGFNIKETIFNYVVSDIVIAPYIEITRDETQNRIDVCDNEVFALYKGHTICTKLAKCKSRNQAMKVAKRLLMFLSKKEKELLYV